MHDLTLLVYLKFSEGADRSWRTRYFCNVSTWLASMPHCNAPVPKYAREILLETLNVCVAMPFQIFKLFTKKGQDARFTLCLPTHATTLSPLFAPCKPRFGTATFDDAWIPLDHSQTLP